PPPPRSPPTRRSSDLLRRIDSQSRRRARGRGTCASRTSRPCRIARVEQRQGCARCWADSCRRENATRYDTREVSKRHAERVAFQIGRDTSELQSRGHL